MSRSVGQVNGSAASRRSSSPRGAYLGLVLRGGGHRRLTAGLAITRSWVSLAAGNTAALAALVGHDPTLVAALAVWFTDVALRAGRLLAPTRSNDHV